MIPYLIPLLMILYCMIQYDINGRVENKSAWYYGIMIYLILLSGFAYRLGGDGQTYLREYSEYSLSDGFGWAVLGKYPGRLPGWVLLNKLCRVVCKDYWFFKLVHATLLNVLMFFGIKNVSKWIFTCLLFYFVLVFADINFQLLRQALAIGIFLNAIPFFERNEWGKYYLVCALGLLFHESILIAFLVPLVKLVKLTTKGLIVYVCVILVFFVLSGSIVNSLLNVLLSGSEVSLKVLHYSNEVEVCLHFSFLLNVLLNGIIPLLFLYVFSKEGRHTSLMYLTLVYVFIYSVGLYIPILYRFNFYFLLFFYSFFIEIFKFLAKKVKRFRLGPFKFNPGFVFLCLCLVLVLYKSKVYFLSYGDSPYPVYVQYYPYSSILTRNTNAAREALFAWF